MLPGHGILRTGVNDGLIYSADTSTFSIIENRYFRRVVYSGPDSVCRNNSSPIQLIRYHKIKDNSITDDQTICSGSAPVQLSGSTPLQGSGVYSYAWQDSTKGGIWTTRGVNNFSFSPPALTDTTWYRRIVNSSKCTNTSLPVRINVHKPITDNNISLLAGGLTDTTICNGQIPNLLTGTVATGGTEIQGDYAYQWIFSNDNTNFVPVSSGGAGITYQPSALTTTTYYKRQVISGACTAVSNNNAPIKITVLPSIANNIISSGKSAVCYNTAPDPLTGGTLSGGAGTYSFIWEQSSDGGSEWTPAAGANNSQSASYQPPVLTIPMKYKRIVKSGANDCCISISNVLDIAINPLPVSLINAGTDASIYSIEKIYHMTADPASAGETGAWSVLNNGTGSIEDISNNLAEVRNLSAGENGFLWTITNGPCNLVDSVYIYINEDFIPQGFSPNSDQLNDKFIIEGLNLSDQIVDLKVVNGAGTEVFSTTNRDNSEFVDWDGKNSRGIDMPEGTYYYLLKITSKANGQVFKRSGFIVLKRY